MKKHSTLAVYAPQLVAAASKGQYDEVERLLPLVVADNYRGEALAKAVQGGHLAVVPLLMASTTWRGAVLDAAVDMGNDQMVEILLQEPSATPLPWTREVVSKFMRAGGSAESQRPLVRMALTRAYIQRPVTDGSTHEEVVETLGKNLISFHDQAAWNELFLAFPDTILDEGVVNALFQEAAARNNTVVLEQLMPYANPKANQSIALVRAASCGHLEMVRCLKPVSDPNPLALAWAANAGCLEVVQELLGFCDPLYDDSGSLRSAAKEGRWKVVEALVDHCDVNAARCGALRMAVKYQQTPVVRILAPRCDLSEVGQECLKEARDKDLRDIMEVLCSWCSIEDMRAVAQQPAGRDLPGNTYLTALYQSHAMQRAIEQDVGPVMARRGMRKI